MIGKQKEPPPLMHRHYAKEKRAREKNVNGVEGKGRMER